MATPEQPQRDELIAAVKSMAPFPILMATCMLCGLVWHGGLLAGQSLHYLVCMRHG